MIMKLTLIKLSGGIEGRNYKPAFLLTQEKCTKNWEQFLGRAIKESFDHLRKQ
jgi:hypothetical protein